MPAKLLVFSAAAVIACAAAFAQTDPATKSLPRLLDLGASKCVPCKMMAPILDRLKADYAGRMDVEFIDVWKNPDAGKSHAIRMIPTQVFYAADGRELFRHEGFFGRDDILAKWKELGVDLGGK
jgi:thioredoxin 1